MPDERKVHWDVVLFIICMFLVTVDAPTAPAWLVWSWKGIAVVAAWGKGKYEDKPGARPKGTEADPVKTEIVNEPKNPVPVEPGE